MDNIWLATKPKFSFVIIIIKQWNLIELWQWIYCFQYKICDNFCSEIFLEEKWNEIHIYVAIFQLVTESFRGSRRSHLQLWRTLPWMSPHLWSPDSEHARWPKDRPTTTAVGFQFEWLVQFRKQLYKPLSW